MSISAAVLLILFHHINQNFRKFQFSNLQKNKLKSHLSHNLKLDSSLQKNVCYLLCWKPFKNDEKYFLFHLKSSCSQDI